MSDPAQTVTPEPLRFDATDDEMARWLFRLRVVRGKKVGAISTVDAIDLARQYGAAVFAETAKRPELVAEVVRELKPAPLLPSPSEREELFDEVRGTADVRQARRMAAGSYYDRGNTIQHDEDTVDNLVRSVIGAVLAAGYSKRSSPSSAGQEVDWQHDPKVIAATFAFMNDEAGQHVQAGLVQKLANAIADACSGYLTP